jgi:phenylpropionate dioxygenase-like ring-hydroxylating dioxygenase large terminal subunit
MKAELRIATLKHMLDLIDRQASHLGESGTIRVSDYSCEDHLARELASLFRDYPILVAHGSSLAEPGSFITVDIGHRPVLVNRDRDGNLRAFLNACRHRGARLTELPCGTARAFKCPYHAWSYLDDGSLKFVPKIEAFPQLKLEDHSLVELPVAQLGGFIWVGPGGNDIDTGSMLAGIEDDLVHFGLPDHVVRVSDVQRPACNWKLVIDAFSEGYHLKSLHKDSVEPFFENHGAVFEKMGLHSRSVGARAEIGRARTTPEANWDFRAWTTPFYTLFPNTVLVFHPDWVSRITVFPEGVDHCVVYHDMLVPKDADLDALYWDKTFKLINQQVFAAEDIAVCENIQSTARSGANSHWHTGGLETPVLWFHQACRAATDPD